MFLEGYFSTLLYCTKPNVSDDVSDDASEYFSDNVSDDVSDDASEYFPDNVSDDVLDVLTQCLHHA